VTTRVIIPISSWTLFTVQGRLIFTAEFRSWIYFRLQVIHCNYADIILLSLCFKIIDDGWVPTGGLLDSITTVAISLKITVLSVKCRVRDEARLKGRGYDIVLPS
jgi:hypothetical protein